MACNKCGRMIAGVVTAVRCDFGWHHYHPGCSPKARR